MPETESPIVREGPSMSLRPNPENSSFALRPSNEAGTPAESMNITSASEQPKPAEPVVQPESSPGLAELTPLETEHPPDDSHKEDGGAWTIEKNDTPAPVDPSEQPFDPATINKDAKPAEEAVTSQPEVINELSQIEPAPVQLPEPEPELEEVTKEVTQEASQKKEPEVIPMNPEIDTKRGLAEQSADEVSSPFASADQVETPDPEMKKPAVGSIQLEQKPEEKANPSEMKVAQEMKANIARRREALKKEDESLAALEKLLNEHPEAAAIIANLPNGLTIKEKDPIGFGTSRTQK